MVGSWLLWKVSSDTEFLRFFLLFFDSSWCLTNLLLLPFPLKLIISLFRTPPSIKLFCLIAVKLFNYDSFGTASTPSLWFPFQSVYLFGVRLLPVPNDHVIAQCVGITKWRVGGSSETRPREDVSVHCVMKWRCNGQVFYLTVNFPFLSLNDKEITWELGFDSLVNKIRNQHSS